jgi:hypothetical protein
MKTLHEIKGTLDEMEPALLAAGFTSVKTLAGALPLAKFDPYGMRRETSVNGSTGAWQGKFIEIDGNAYLTDAKPATLPFINGLFPLLK